MCDLPLVCPACGEGFRGLGHSQEPLTFTCGHSVCRECAEAVMLVELSRCCVCTVPVQACVPNPSLAILLEERCPHAHPSSPPPLQDGVGHGGRASGATNNLQALEHPPLTAEKTNGVVTQCRANAATCRLVASTTAPQQGEANEAHVRVHAKTLEHQVRQDAADASRALEVRAVLL